MRQTERYRHYLLALLLIVLAFSYVDRMVFGVLLQQIKIDMDLTDSQIGVLSGIVFALFFAIAGIPLARWVDRGDRVVIVAVTTGLWGIAVALCGAASSFIQLAFARVGTAIGEAGCNPPANSLIPEYFQRAERPRAVARYMLGVPLGLTVGYFCGGWLNELFGWRMTFVIVGLPGLVLAALALLSLHEPRRSAARLHDRREAMDAPGLHDVIALIAGKRTFRHLLLCFLVWYFTGWALVQWTPAFFIRTHGLATGELGTWLAAVHGIGGLGGTLLGGEWASRFAARNERKQLAVVAALFVGVGIVNIGALLAPSHQLAFGALLLHALGSAVITGPLFATLQTIVPPRMRATALALISTFPIFVGMGLGPWVAGLLSDLLARVAGGESLRFALLLLCPGMFCAACYAWLASKSVTGDVTTMADSPELRPEASCPVSADGQ